MRFLSLISCLLGGLCIQLPAMAQQSSDQGSASSWLTKLQPEAGVYTEMQKFGNLPDFYIQDFPNRMKLKILSEFQNATRSLLQNKDCDSRIKVNFLKKISADAESNSAIKDFESQFIRIEVLSCLPQVNATQVAQAYLSPTYQKNAFDTVVTSNHQGPRVCQRTQTMGLGRSEYCYNNSVLKTDAGVFIHSFNDFNVMNIEAPVYFREILTTAINVPQGTLFYTLAYVRGVNLNSLFRFAAKGVIEDSQTKAINLLQQMSQQENVQ